MRFDNGTDYGEPDARPFDVRFLSRGSADELAKDAAAFMAAETRPFILNRDSDHSPARRNGNRYRRVSRGVLQRVVDQIADRNGDGVAIAADRRVRLMERHVKP